MYTWREESLLKCGERVHEGGEILKGGGTRYEASCHLPTDTQLGFSSLEGSRCACFTRRSGAVPSPQSHSDPIYCRCLSGWGCGESCPQYGGLYPE